MDAWYHPTKGITRIRSLAATCLAAAVLLATGSAPVTRTARAEETTLAAESNNAGICTPKRIPLGDDVSNSQVDTGIATYVGRDMYVGGKYQDSNPSATLDTTDLNGSNAPDGSYAVEAEGLTVVNGKLALNPLKNSWSITDESNRSYSPGFRFGTVGFGAQFRPADGASLVVGKQGSGIGTMTTGGVNDATVGAWTHGSWTGQSAVHKGGKNYQVNTASPAYTAQVVGQIGKWESNNSHDAVVGQQNNWAKDANSDNWEYAAAMNVNGTDYSGYDETVLKLSAALGGSKTNGTVEQHVAPADSSYTRYKYNYGGSNGKQNLISYQFSFSGAENTSNAEKVLYFKGDGKSMMQVFSVTAGQLSSNGYRGLDFAFSNIPDGASVVINVTGTGSAQTIDFHTGWRFWWTNENVDGWDSWDKSGDEISNGYVTTSHTRLADIEAMRDKYVAAAQSIMWNFRDLNQLTIRGGIATEGRDADGKWTDDDPAAAMLGSILVPTGSFESHVTTNGRVYVGEDFSMYNPTVAFTFGAGVGEGASASVIDMDQERHNLPWSGSYTSDCSVIGWEKVASDSSNRLGGSEWGIYRSEEDARSNRNPLLIVDDNGNNDASSTEGVITVRSLNPNATYYIKELKAPDGYQVSEKIYSVTTTSSGETVNTVQGDGDGKIQNSPNGADVQWKKYAAGDADKTGLSGSVWTLSALGDGDAVTASWTVEDNTVSVTSVVVSQNDSATGPTTLPQSTTAQLTATVWYGDGTTSNSSHDVTWSSADESIATVNDSGLVIAKQPGRTEVIACAVADPSVCGRREVIVTPIEVSDITITLGGDLLDTGDTVEVSVDGITDLDASATTVNGTPVTVTWSSDDTSVATVNAATGEVTGRKVGVATITATAGDKSVSVIVRVTDSDQTIVYFRKSAVNWGTQVTYYLAYGVSGAAAWTYVPMQDSACNGDYVYATIPRPGGNVKFKITDKPSNVSGGRWYPAGTGTDIPFNNRSVVTVTEGNQHSAIAPDCVARSTVSASAAADRADGEGSGDTASDGSDSSDGSDGEGDQTGDSSDRAAAAASIADCRQDGYKCDVDTKVGSFRVHDLPDGRYSLTEKTAPAGYTRNTTVYRFTITNGKVNWDDQQAAIIDGVTLGVADKPTKVSWTKVDNNHGQLLAGSQWRITPAQSSPAASAVYCVADNNAAIDTNACSNGKTLQDTDDTTGSISVERLPVGVYTLKEVVAPTGFTASNETYTFTVTTGATTDIRLDGDAGTNGVPNTVSPVSVQLAVRKAVRYTAWPTADDGSYIPFTFKLSKGGNETQQNIPSPFGCNIESEDDCTVTLAPSAGGADDVTTVTSMFNQIIVSANHLGGDETNGYENTYTYRITEVTPAADEQVANLRYSKAEYKVQLTVRQTKDADGNWAGLKTNIVMTRVKDDSGNSDNTVIGPETGDDADGQAVATFVNTKVQTGLPATGADWTGRRVFTVGGAFMLAGALLAGGYELTTKRREATRS